MIDLRCGDALAILGTLPDASVDCIVTDPPYGIKFLGKDWDHGVPGVPYWAAALDVLKPGGYMFAFGGTRTYHRLTVAIEDAGFEIRDCVMWLHAQGFPKSRACLKPAWEPIVLARRKGETVSRLNIDACRIPIDGNDPQFRPSDGFGGTEKGYSGGWTGVIERTDRHPMSPRHSIKGRWPANVAHDGSDEVMETFAAFGDRASGTAGPVRRGDHRPGNMFHHGESVGTRRGDAGSVSRFYYCAKVRHSERRSIPHPTAKPTELMRWLVRLIATPGDLVLDPFCGSGSTGVAAVEEGCRFLGIDQNPDYIGIARRRLMPDAETIGALQ